MPGTIHCTAGPCNATAGPGTRCGQRQEGEIESREQCPRAVCKGGSWSRLQATPDRPAAWEGRCPGGLPFPRPIWMPGPTHHPSPQAGSHRSKGYRSHGRAYQTLQSSWMVALGGYHCPPWRQGQSSGGTQRSSWAEAGDKGPPCWIGHHALATVSDSQGSRAGPHAAPSPTYQPHSARRADTAPWAAWRASVLSPLAVTGEEAGTGGVDKLTRAECPLWGAAASSAVPEAPLLADTTKVKDGRG